MASGSGGDTMVKLALSSEYQAGVFALRVLSPATPGHPSQGSMRAWVVSPAPCQGTACHPQAALLGAEDVQPLTPLVPQPLPSKGWGGSSNSLPNKWLPHSTADLKGARSCVHGGVHRVGCPQLLTSPTVPRPGVPGPLSQGPVQLSGPALTSPRSWDCPSLILAIPAHSQGL